MRIILEGPDGSGKSTLARTLADALGTTVQAGQGPEKYPGEINERIARYIGEHNRGRAILDRHPAVSHPIYSLFSGAQQADTELVCRFYQLPSLFIYCKGGSLDNHVHNEHDTEKQLGLLERHYADICKQYDQWARLRAHVWYDFRVDDPQFIIRIAKGVLQHG